MTDKQPEARSDIDYLYTAVTADTNALEDAKMTLEVIKKTDPGVYDEMINDTLSLIRKSLSSSILGVIEKTDAELRRLHEENQQWKEKCDAYIAIHDAVVKDNERLHEVNAELVEALEAIMDVGDTSLQLIYPSREAADKAKAALRKAQGDNNAN